LGEPDISGMGDCADKPRSANDTSDHCVVYRAGAVSTGSTSSRSTDSTGSPQASSGSATPQAGSSVRQAQDDPERSRMGQGPERVEGLVAGAAVHSGKWSADKRRPCIRLPGNSDSCVATSASREERGGQRLDPKSRRRGSAVPAGAPASGGGGLGGEPEGACTGTVGGGLFRRRRLARAASVGLRALAGTPCAAGGAAFQPPAPRSGGKRR